MFTFKSLLSRINIFTFISDPTNSIEKVIKVNNFFHLSQGLPVAVGPGTQLINVKRSPFHLSGWIPQSAPNWSLKGQQTQLGNDPFQKSPKAPNPLKDFVSLCFHSFRGPEGPPKMYRKCTGMIPFGSKMGSQEGGAGGRGDWGGMRAAPARGGHISSM